MDNRIRLNQNGGNDSTNYQAENINIQYGVTYTEVKEIALDIFNKNFITLSEQAAIIAKKRAEELVDDYLKALHNEMPENLGNIIDPGIQYAIFNAQKEFARTGDKEISEMFVKILVERISLLERNMKQIAIDESFLILPKLTLPQVDLLTLIYLIKYPSDQKLINESFSIIHNFLPFTGNQSYGKSNLEHLIYSNCVFETSSANNIEILFNNNYKNKLRFWIWEWQATKMKDKINISILNQILSYYLEDENRWKLSNWKENHVTEYRKIFNIDIKGDDVNFYVQAINAGRNISYNIIKEYLLSHGSAMSALMEEWNNTQLKYLALTNVGKVIAHANYTRKTGETIKFELL